MVSVYTYSSVHRLKIAPVQPPEEGRDKKKPPKGGDAVGYILEYITKTGKPATLTKTIILAGLFADTNKNHAELFTLAEAIKRIKPEEPIKVYTDNMFVATQFQTDRVQQWKDTGWTNAKGEPISNAAEWEKLLDALNGHQTEWHIREHHSYSSYLQDEVENKRSCV